MSDFDPWADERGDGADAVARRAGADARRPGVSDGDDFDPFAEDVTSPARTQGTPMQTTPATGATPAGEGRSTAPPRVVEVSTPETRRERRARRVRETVEPAGAGRILTVCTGNICRSPYMERVLAHELAPLGVQVSSAGTGALDGRPIEPGSVALLEARGIDVSRFAARQLQAEMVEAADLVLTATREHRRLVVQEAPSALGRVFAVLDFADLCEGLSAADIERAPGDNVVARLAAAAGARRALVPARLDGDADVIDPFTGGDAAFRQMQAQLDVPLAAIVKTLRAGCSI